MSWSSVEDAEVAETVKNLRKKQRREVLVRTPKGGLVKGYETPLGCTTSSCHGCFSTASKLKWQIRFAAIEGLGSAIDRYCMKCRSQRVIPFDQKVWEDSKNAAVR